ncbi:MAG: DUF4232 domain-containing protein [Chloroflexota bacterium]
MNSLRVLITAVLLGVAFAAAGVAHSTSAAPAASGSVHRCYNIQIMVRPYRTGPGAAGHVHLLYRVHNLWGGACTLYGYPGMLLLNRYFYSLPTHVKRSSGMGQRRLVTLDSNHDGYFEVAYSDVPSGPGPCRAAPYLMITIPNANLPIVTYSHTNHVGPNPFAPCRGQIDVGPIESTARFL